MAKEDGVMTFEEYKAKMDAASEAEIYVTVDFLGGIMWRTNHDASHGRCEPMEKKEAEDLQKRIEYAASQTTKFGVEKVTTADGRPTAAYWAWFRWWDKWAKALSDKEFYKIDEILKGEGDLFSWRPSGDWRESLPEEEKNFQEGERLHKKIKESGKHPIDVILEEALGSTPEAEQLKDGIKSVLSINEATNEEARKKYKQGD